MNTTVTPIWTLKQVGTRLTNNLRFVGQINKSYSNEFKQGGCKVGVTVNARLPQRYVVNKGQAFVAQAVTDNIVPITITDQANVGIEFDTFTLTMQVEDYKKRYIDPAGEAMANQVDLDGLTRSYQDVFWHVGTPGVVPGSSGTLPYDATDVYLQAGVKLDNYGVSGKRSAILSPAMHAGIAKAVQTLFNPSADITKAYKTGQFSGEALGIQQWFMDQNVPTHVVGTTTAGTPLVNGASQTGASIIADGYPNSTLVHKKGDIVTFGTLAAGVHTVNPMSRQSTGQLQQFVITADVTSDGSGNATLPISPSIVTSGQWQTVSQSPPNNAAILTFGEVTSHSGKTTKQGLVFVEEAFAMVTADLEKPMGVWASERISNKAVGVAMRFVKDYSIMTDQSPARLDMIYGFKTVRPEMACRVSS